MNIAIDQAFTATAENVREESNHTRFLHSSNYIVAVTVSGRGAFPVDQLRRHPSFPADGGSAANLIQPNYRETDNRDVELWVVADSPRATDLHAMADRYASFGWSVTAVTISVDLSGEKA